MIQPQNYRAKDDPYRRIVSAFQFHKLPASSSQAERIQHASEYPGVKYNTLTGNFTADGRYGGIVLGEGWYIVYENASPHAAVFTESKFNDTFELAHNAPQWSETGGENDVSDNTCEDETCVSVDPGASERHSRGQRYAQDVLKKAIDQYRSKENYILSQIDLHNPNTIKIVAGYFEGLAILQEFLESIGG